MAVAATTGDKTSLSLSLELGSAVAGMSGLGPKGSSSWWKKGGESQPLWAQCLLGSARGTPPTPPRLSGTPEAANARDITQSAPIPRRYHKERAGGEAGLGSCLLSPSPGRELGGVPNVEGDFRQELLI